MNWKQSIIPFGQLAELPVQEALYAVTLSQAATGGMPGIDRRVALLSRSEAGKHAVLLLTPEAAPFAANLPGEWTEVSGAEVRQHGWGVLYSAGASLEELGVRAAHQSSAP